MSSPFYRPSILTFDDRLRALAATDPNWNGDGFNPSVNVLNWAFLADEVYRFVGEGLQRRRATLGLGDSSREAHVERLLRAGAWLKTEAENNIGYFVGYSADRAVRRLIEIGVTTSEEVLALLDD